MNKEFLNAHSINVSERITQLEKRGRLVNSNPYDYRFYMQGWKRPWVPGTIQKEEGIFPSRLPFNGLIGRNPNEKFRSWNSSYGSFGLPFNGWQRDDLIRARFITELIASENGPQIKLTPVRGTDGPTKNDFFYVEGLSPQDVASFGNLGVRQIDGSVRIKHGHERSTRRKYNPELDLGYPVTLEEIWGVQEIYTGKTTLEDGRPILLAGEVISFESSKKRNAPNMLTVLCEDGTKVGVCVEGSNYFQRMRYGSVLDLDPESGLTLPAGEAFRISSTGDLKKVRPQYSFKFSHDSRNATVPTVGTRTFLRNDPDHGLSLINYNIVEYSVPPAPQTKERVQIKAVHVNEEFFTSPSRVYVLEQTDSILQ